jgi:predicted DNA-binding transcriptional regulator YafY
MDEKRMKVLVFTYQNHKGVTSRRRVRVLHWWFGALPEYYGEEEYNFLKCHDLDRGDTRDFRVAGMKDIEEETFTPPVPVQEADREDP